MLFPDQPQPLLMTWEQLRARARGARGSTSLVRERFTHAFAALAPEEFLRDVIAERLAPREVFVGRDFHFGKGRAGSGEMAARARAPALGIRVEIIAQVRAGERRRVEHARSARRSRAATSPRPTLCLGRPYTIWGRVVEGDRRGRTLGFPTANLAPENELVPAERRLRDARAAVRRASAPGRRVAARR